LHAAGKGKGIQCVAYCGSTPCIDCSPALSTPQRGRLSRPALAHMSELVSPETFNVCPGPNLRLSGMT
jgi:hypothetical protein